MDILIKNGSQQSTVDNNGCANPRVETIEIGEFLWLKHRVGQTANEVPALLCFLRECIILYKSKDGFEQSAVISCDSGML